MLQARQLSLIIKMKDRKEIDIKSEEVLTLFIVAKVYVGRFLSLTLLRL